MARMALTREEIAKSTANKLAAAAGGLGQTKALIGLDGFVDEIVAVVDKRHGPDRYDPVDQRSPPAGPARSSTAAGQSRATTS